MNSTANSPGFAIVEVLVSNCRRLLTNSQLLAFSMHWALFAILTVQLYLYYQAFPNDRVFTKVLVYTVYCITLIPTILATIDTFNTFGYGFGDPSALATTRFAWLVTPVFGGIVACIVQSFYAYRLYQLSKSRIVPSILVFAALDTAPRLNLAKLGTNLPTGLAATIMLFLVGTALIDITIAGCMTYYLIKSDTGFRGTHALVTKLIRLSIETGAFTALGAILILALFFGIPGKTYYVVPGNSISTAYANTMFAVLNSRIQILNGRTDRPTSDILISIPSHLRDPVGGPVVSITREDFSDGSNPPIELKKRNPTTYDQVGAWMTLVHAVSLVDYVD
ncbi:hypothetical protein C8F04DRAFT_1180840 [Mycena alexandri]|uniref:DUF6534 domain-containing protein n=1 Tax=Mycena alexandri TaxID=1745969 RepID=A0AAD6T4H2_9AGAR|nr:hypothetical protein C8F04DRAFT_1180840 [Mycena alexandri]